mmetsp:Transcript_34230/g.83014  ORF Transcript_34230/g.83014 Transcript_34230/m.83014 type:complete len:212 (-) Transcript_34230:605-1240(-)
MFGPAADMVSAVVWGRTGDMPPLTPRMTIFLKEGVDRVRDRSGGARWGGAPRLRRLALLLLVLLLLLLLLDEYSGNKLDVPDSAALHICFFEVPTSVSLTTRVEGNCILSSLRLRVSAARTFVRVTIVSGFLVVVSIVVGNSMPQCCCRLLMLVAEALLPNLGFDDSAARTRTRLADTADDARGGIAAMEVGNSKADPLRCRIGLKAGPSY